MTSKIKALALSFFALLAIGAVGASTASAVGVHGEAATTHLTAEAVAASPPAFQLANGTKTICEELSIEDGTQITTTTQAHLLVTPTFGKCKTAGQETHVTNPDGCQFTFTTTTTTTGTGSIVCPTGKSITIEVTNAAKTAHTCTVHIGTQVPTTPTVDYAAGTKNAKIDVTATSTVTGVTYTTTPASGTICGSASNAGKLTGQGTLFGFGDVPHNIPTGVTIA